MSPATFSLAVSPPSAAVRAGSATNFDVTITPSNFSGVVVLSCGNLPTGANCAFLPNTVPLNGAAVGTSVLTVSTTAPVVGKIGSVGRWLAWSLLLPAAVLLFPGDGASSKQRLAVVGLGVLMLLLLAGCGGNGRPTIVGSPPGSATGPTPPGNYMITVIGTAGPQQGTATVMLTVQ